MLLWWSVTSPHKGQVTRNMLPFYDVIMEGRIYRLGHHRCGSRRLDHYCLKEWLVACTLPSHYLNQFSRIVIWNNTVTHFWDRILHYIDRNFGNVFRKMIAVLSRPQTVDTFLLTISKFNINNSIPVENSYFFSENCSPQSAKSFSDGKVHGPTLGPSGADRTQVGPMLPHDVCYLGYHCLQCISHNSLHDYGRWPSNYVRSNMKLSQCLIITTWICFL